LATLLAILKRAVVGILVNAWSHFHIPATHTLSSHTHKSFNDNNTELSSQEKTQSNNLSPTPNGYIISKSDDGIAR
jgi:hypothetical protein